MRTNAERAAQQTESSTSAGFSPRDWVEALTEILEEAKRDGLPKVYASLALVGGTGRKITKWEMEKLTAKLPRIERNLAANTLE